MSPTGRLLCQGLSQHSGLLFDGLPAQHGISALTREYCFQRLTVEQDQAFDLTDAIKCTAQTGKPLQIRRQITSGLEFDRHHLRGLGKLRSYV